MSSTGASLAWHSIARVRPPQAQLAKIDCIYKILIFYKILNLKKIEELKDLLGSLMQCLCLEMRIRIVWLSVIRQSPKLSSTSSVKAFIGN